MSDLSSLTAAMHSASVSKRTADIVFSESDDDEEERKEQAEESSSSEEEAEQEEEEEEADVRSIRSLVGELGALADALSSFLFPEGDEPLQEVPTAEDILSLLAPLASLRTTIDAACAKYNVAAPGNKKAPRKVRSHTHTHTHTAPGDAYTAAASVLTAVVVAVVIVVVVAVVVAAVVGRKRQEEGEGGGCARRGGS